MRFASILSLLPLALAASLAPQVVEQIGVLNSSLAELTAAVNAFNGSLLNVIPQSLAVITAETSLDAATLKTTAITKLSSNFTEAESTSVVIGLAGLISPIQASLSALTGKVSAMCCDGCCNCSSLNLDAVRNIQEGTRVSDCAA